MNKKEIVKELECFFKQQGISEIYTSGIQSIFNTKGAKYDLAFMNPASHNKYDFVGCTYKDKILSLNCQGMLDELPSQLVDLISQTFFGIYNSPEKGLHEWEGIEKKDILKAQINKAS